MWKLGVTVCLFWFMSQCTQCRAEMIIMTIGDSIAANSAHRRYLQEIFEGNQVSYDFVGDVHSAGNPVDTNHQAFGGARYSAMLHGRTVDRGNGPVFEAGVIDALPRYSPNTILLLGGYNNMAQETVGGGLLATKAEYTALVDYIVTHSPNANLFVSNITDFDPSKQWGYKRDNVLEWNNYLMSDTLSRVSLGQRVRLVDNFSSVNYDDLLAEGLHVAQTGHLKIAQNWYSAITAVPEPSSAFATIWALFIFVTRGRFSKATPTKFDR